MTGLERMHLDRGAEHVHRLGARAVAELLAEVAQRIGGAPAILSALAEYERLAPGQVRTAGGDRFPVRMRVAPGGRG